jgi:protein-L-isoaspartate(D-aspartate) O-methyltransferase
VDPGPLGDSGGIREAELPQPLDAVALLTSLSMPDLPLARAWMCERLRAARISERTLKAFSEVPRHAFAPVERWRVAYLDLDLWTGHAWMTGPGSVARVVDALGPVCGERVLEIGTGTGYQTAVLAALGAEVVSVELSPACAVLAAERLRAMGAERTKVVHGNGFELTPAGFDRVVVNGALMSPAAYLVDTLRQWPGVLVASFLMADRSQRLLRWDCAPDREPRVTDLGPCRLAAISAVPT